MCPPPLLPLSCVCENKIIARCDTHHYHHHHHPPVHWGGVWSAAAGRKGEGTHTVTASITSSRGPDTVAYGHQWSALHWLLIASNKQKTLLVSGLIISRPVLIWLPEHFYNAKLGWVDITIFRPTNANDYPSCLELLVIVFIVISTFIQAHTLGNTLKFKTSKYQRIVV